MKKVMAVTLLAAMLLAGCLAKPIPVSTMESQITVGSSPKAQVPAGKQCEQSGTGNATVEICPSLKWFYRFVYLVDGTGSINISYVFNNDESLNATAKDKMRGQAPVYFNVDGNATIKITTDGSWSFYLEPLTLGSTGECSGEYSFVSDMFETNKQQAFIFNHTGNGKYALMLCGTNGNELIAEAQGEATTRITREIEAGQYGYWYVISDDPWTITKSDK